MKSSSRLTHFDDQGASQMVDVGSKKVTQRLARAEGFVSMKAETVRLIQNRELSKGDVLEVARLAGIMGTKRTSDLIPLCHPLGIDHVSVEFEFVEPNKVRIEATVGIDGKTGVEMEALTAVSVAALTIYDMCKSVDREMSIQSVRLLEKKGGKSGHYIRQSE